MDGVKPDVIMQAFKIILDPILNKNSQKNEKNHFSTDFKGTTDRVTTTIFDNLSLWLENELETKNALSETVWFQEGKIHHRN